MDRTWTKVKMIIYSVQHALNKLLTRQEKHDIPRLQNKASLTTICSINRRDKNMGNRGNIKVQYQEGQPIYFYTHWSGSTINSIVRKALKRGQDRWEDESYLARIIFSELIKDELLWRVSRRSRRAIL